MLYLLVKHFNSTETCFREGNLVCENDYCIKLIFLVSYGTEFSEKKCRFNLVHLMGAAMNSQKLRRAFKYVEVSNDRVGERKRKHIHLCRIIV